MAFMAFSGDFGLSLCKALMTWLMRDLESDGFTFFLSEVMAIPFSNQI